MEEDEQICTHCGYELEYEPEYEPEYQPEDEPEPKRPRISVKTIVIICVSVVLVAALAFLALRILDFARNPPPPQPPPEILDDQPQVPTGPPDLPAGAGDEQPEAEPEAARVYAAGGLRMREGPGTDYEIIVVIPSYEHVTVLEEEGGWAYVEYGSISGWVSAEFLLREDDPRFWEEPQEAVVTSGSRSQSPTAVRINAASGLRMRMGPGAEYHVVMIIPYEEVVLAHDQNEGWVYVEHLGHWGWVSAEFLLDE